MQNLNFLWQVEVYTKEKLGWNLLASENFFQGMIILCAGTEVEFVHAVTAGGSVKFFPAV